MSFHRCALFCMGASIHFHTNTDDCDLISEEVRRLAGAMASFQRRARRPRSHGDVHGVGWGGGGGGSSAHLLSCSSPKNDRKCELNFKKKQKTKRWYFSPTSTSSFYYYDYYLVFFRFALCFVSVLFRQSHSSASLCLCSAALTLPAPEARAWWQL